MTSAPQKPLVALVLPGPDRKRTLSPYFYRVTYRNPVSGEAGCAMTWDVYGGREVYQIALENKAGGDTAWHCSCADAVYREHELQARPRASGDVPGDAGGVRRRTPPPGPLPEAERGRKRKTKPALPSDPPPRLGEGPGVGFVG